MNPACFAVRTSRIDGAGDGAFYVGKPPVRRGTILGRYDGVRHVDHAEHSAYCLMLRDGTCVDGLTSTSWTRFANNGGHAGLRNNARFTAAGNMVATRTIRSDDEVLVSYGGAYWERG